MTRAVPIRASPRSPTRGRRATASTTVLDDEDLSGGDFVRNVQAAHRPAPPGRRARRRSRETRRAADAGGRRAVPRGGGGLVADRLGGGRRRAARPRRRCRSGGASPGAHRGALPADGVVVRTDAEARAVVEPARRAGEDPPRSVCSAVTCAGRSAVPATSAVCDAGRRGRRVDLGAALVDGRLHWFVAHLVARRGWWRGRIVVLMNAQWLGDWDVGPALPPRRRSARHLHVTMPAGERLKARPGCRRAPTSRTRASTSHGSRSRSSSSRSRPRSASTARWSAPPDRCRSASNPPPSASSSEPRADIGAVGSACAPTGQLRSVGAGAGVDPRREPGRLPLG